MQHARCRCGTKHMDPKRYGPLSVLQLPTPGSSAVRVRDAGARTDLCRAIAEPGDGSDSTHAASQY